MKTDAEKKKLPEKIDLDILNSSFWQATIFTLVEDPLIISAIKEHLKKKDDEGAEDAHGNLCINPD